MNIKTLLETVGAGEGAILCSGSLRPICTGESADCRGNTLLGQAQFREFIFSQEAGLKVRSLCTFPAKESLPAESILATETQKGAGLPELLTEANRITGGTSSSQRQL